jgi:dTDP-4-amino-4,6-dideoxygalactose transaminase
MHVPFVDLQAQYISIKEDIDQAIAGVLRQAMFVGGEKVQIFEQTFASLIGAKHCIGVGNGTDALYLILKALGINSHHEVLVPANSWISSAETISQTGAAPVFVDIDVLTYTISINQLAEKITPKTKAIVVVHLFGQAANMQDLTVFCKQHNLYLIEDCAQAHLTEDNAKIVGTFGDAAAFSFYPSKNLGAYGDAGAVLTSNDELATHIRRFANHGGLSKHEHFMEGTNSRLDSLQAAILLAKIPHLKKWTAQRIEHAANYTASLSTIAQVQTPHVRANTRHSFHVYAIITKSRNALMNFLGERGIQTAIHYPVALPYLPAYAHLHHTASDFPVTHAYQDQLLSLPLFPELRTDQQAYICKSIHAFFRQ